MRTAWSGSFCIAQPIVGIGLAALDLLLGELARAQRIAAGQLGRGGVVGDRLHLEDVQAAEFGDLLEGERGVVDQPGSGRMGHERLGHVIFSKNDKGRPFAERPVPVAI